MDILALIEKIKGKRIVVCGDCMIDQYIMVEANRINPEHPSVILKTEDDKPYEEVLGGAANVAAQFKHFPVEVFYVGFIDDRIYDLFKKTNINTDYSIRLSRDYNVPLKKRYYDRNGCPLTRIDIEKKNYGLEQKYLKQLQNQLFHNLDYLEASVVIFSDYDKGVFVDRQVDINKKYISIVDPKKGPIGRWTGADIIKPNNKEAKELTGLEKWQDQAKFIHNMIGGDVLITHGDEGVKGVFQGSFFEYSPLKKVAAESLIGAGDSFIAFLAMGMVAEIENPIELAYEAGATYVKNKHNTPLTPNDIEVHYGINSKFRMPEEENLVFTNGVFDILHSQHIKLLQFAKKQGDKLVVAVNSDDSVKRLKGTKRPINTLKNRMEVLAALECVDYVVSFDEDTPIKLIKMLNISKIIKGGDYEGKDVVGAELAEVVFFPYLEGVSTTEIIHSITTINSEAEINRQKGKEA